MWINRVFAVRDDFYNSPGRIHTKETGFLQFFKVGMNYFCNKHPLPDSPCVQDYLRNQLLEGKS